MNGDYVFYAFQSMETEVTSTKDVIVQNAINNSFVKLGLVIH